MTLSIERSIDIAAPVARVWQALTDHRAFGAWFNVRIDAPFRLGEVSRGRITIPGFEHVPWEATVVTLSPQTSFAYTWHPYAVDPDTDYSEEEPTQVEFTLLPIDTGTRLTVRESGFDRIPAQRRAEALRMNTGGWEAQLRNIADYASRPEADPRAVQATGTA